MPHESELLIKQLCANTLELLNRYWKQAELLSANTAELRIAITHSVTPGTKGGYDAASTVSFGKRIKDQVKHNVNPDQTEMDLHPKAKAVSRR